MMTRAWALLLLLAVAPGAAAAPEAMCRVEGGDYLPLYARDAAADRVRVKPFLLDSHAVTHAEYLDFVRACPEWRRSRVSRLLADANYLAQWAGDLDLGPRAAALERSPVTQVSWFAARAYARWRGKRLPSVAEWEYAAGAGASGTDPGTQQRILDWYARPVRLPLPPVESTAPNRWGAWDLHGLAWEWVEDFNSALVTGESRADSDLERRFFCAGGAVGATDLTDYAAFMRYAFRSSLHGADCLNSLGFRCARDLNTDPPPGGEP
ncbi:MAG: formylglycine-generating enzyme family protein [Candidatus Latescibacteria bacterium]|nr:formylglycine-generating enzyme family protein [bacterium]MCB9513953.1 formylglycine-generating enzyme family protein [Candidatus Latescibacterota bacterium]